MLTAMLVLLLNAFMASARAAAPASDWIELSLRGRCILVDPCQPASLHQVPPPVRPTEVVSPDGSRVLHVGSGDERGGAGDAFDLFIAKVDATTPSGRSEVRRATTLQTRPSAVRWLADGRGVVFLAAKEGAAAAVWFLSIDPLEDPVQVSAGNGPCEQLTTLPTGDIAYVQVRSRERKQVRADLIVQPVVPNPARRVVVGDRHISAFAIAPDGGSLIWGGPDLLQLVDLRSGATFDLAPDSIHPKLRHHLPRALSWSPDGRLVAAQLSFAGGIARSPDAKPDDPWPRLFAEDKVFILPVAWLASPKRERAAAGGTFVSPFQEDAESERSPLPGDHSQPWWIAGLPTAPISISWVSESTAQTMMSSAVDAGTGSSADQRSEHEPGADAPGQRKSAGDDPPVAGEVR